jgi:hypothetical protein
MTFRGDESPQQPAHVAKVLTLKADVIWTQITKPLKAPRWGFFYDQFQMLGADLHPNCHAQTFSSKWLNGECYERKTR